MWGLLAPAPGGPAYQAVQVIVVPHEGVEGAQLGPAHAQLLGGVAQEAAHVRPHQGHPEQTELQDLCGAEPTAQNVRAGPPRWSS